MEGFYMTKITYANDCVKKSDWRVFADFAQILIKQARELYQSDTAPVNIDATMFSCRR